LSIDETRSFKKKKATNGVIAMTKYDNWTALSARIRGLIDASHLAAELFARNNDALGGMIHLGKHALAILNDLDKFGATLDDSSEHARLAIKKLASEAGELFNTVHTTTDMRQIYIRSGLLMLAAAETELSYLLRDRQAAIRALSDRAFEHLQRTIVVDDSVRQKWVNAFDTGEPECEKLGAVHLLSHGIWAFKANATGGRTDLVYQEPLTNINAVERFADGLVLTEWKKLSDGGNPTRYFESARNQSDFYSTGVLAGTELTRYRYAILVSREDVDVPDDFSNGLVTYRHVNIAIEPRTPSKRH
jgi:hypothetical protein